MPCAQGAQRTHQVTAAIAKLTIRVASWKSLFFRKQSFIKLFRTPRGPCWCHANPLPIDGASTKRELRQSTKCQSLEMLLGPYPQTASDQVELPALQRLMGGSGTDSHVESPGPRKDCPTNEVCNTKYVGPWELRREELDLES